MPCSSSLGSSPRDARDAAGAHPLRAPATAEVSHGPSRDHLVDLNRLARGNDTPARGNGWFQRSHPLSRGSRSAHLFSLSGPAPAVGSAKRTAKRCATLRRSSAIASAGYSSCATASAGSTPGRSTRSGGRSTSRASGSDRSKITRSRSFSSFAKPACCVTRPTTSSASLHESLQPPLEARCPERPLRSSGWDDAT